ncbi:MAG TPA: HPr family phosphocarrier protein [Gammaproteobacteria bacterium]|nr:HPr family phosphocarrier protein [Gammaproteobacteria bacterium]
MITRSVIIINRLGLHARAAARFVKLASVYESNVELISEHATINGKSIMGVMMLAAAKGTRLELRVHGPDELESATALKKLIEDYFGEDE